MQKIYQNAINASSNKNIEYQTKGLKFSFLNNESVNASASIMSSYDYMLLNVGTITRLFEYFFSAFSSKVMFPHIGVPHIEHGIEIKSQFDFKKKQILFTDMPKDEARKTVAEYTTLFVIRYIIAHELGHLLNGHLYLVNSLYSVSKIEMILKYKIFSLSKGNLTDYALDRRTLEMDADAFAASISISNLTGIILNKNQFQNFLNSLENPLQIFELWTFAVHSIFMMFEQESSKEYSQKSFYLPNISRELLNLDAAMNALDGLRLKGYFKCNDTDYNFIKNYFYSGINIAEKFFNNFKCTNYEFINDIKNNVCAEECDKVLKNWNNRLRAKLEKYARAILYNPAGMEY